ncbi:hypothetical protein H2200_000198 [Cladophialophora chaetospira]|uniref:EthD domain-containing protein n=1 Tax=Cladophialophora chaetospira TaxID=386627 RepID=A0AA39CNZ4_9EURO|nr:hypothetical protein H2200_000198 [Cladophialophora chaetospira]
MVFNATVLTLDFHLQYPAESDSTFDLKYYLSSHMPLVNKKWNEYGLKDWKIIEFQPGPDGSKPYSIGAVLTWESADGVNKALSSDAGKEVLGDVPNFSNKSPLFLIGDIVGAS